MLVFKERKTSFSRQQTPFNHTSSPPNHRHYLQKPNRPPLSLPPNIQKESNIGLVRSDDEAMAKSDVIEVVINSTICMEASFLKLEIVRDRKEDVGDFGGDVEQEAAVLAASHQSKEDGCI